MKPVCKYESFRSFLKDEFDFRTKRNSLYSLRAFARDLNVSHSRLSEFLSGKHPISARTGQRICRSLSLANEDSDYLINLIRSEFHPNMKVRRAALEAASQRRQTQFLTSNGEADLLGCWYYLPLIVFMTLPKPMNENEIAERLGVDNDTVREAIDFLAKEQFIEFDGTSWKKSHAFFKFESGAPSPHFKAYHEMFLRMAAQSLHSDPIQERKFITWVFTFDDSDVEEARRELEEFSADFVRKFSERKSSNSVFSLGVQFYGVGNSNVRT
jgi:uncharacterized protein (TIGR02147 family)